MNNNPCGNCIHFDEIVLGDGRRKGRQGWCAVKSLYPHQELAGQSFPKGVKRGPPGERGKPVIVTRLAIVDNCATFKAR